MYSVPLAFVLKKTIVFCILRCEIHFFKFLTHFNCYLPTDLYIAIIYMVFKVPGKRNCSFSVMREKWKTFYLTAEYAKCYKNKKGNNKYSGCCKK